MPTIGTPGWDVDRGGGDCHLGPNAFAEHHELDLLPDPVLADQPTDRVLVGGRHAVDGEDKITWHQELVRRAPDGDRVDDWHLGDRQIVGAQRGHHRVVLGGFHQVGVLGLDLGGRLPRRVDRVPRQGVAVRQPVGQQGLRQAQPCVGRGDLR